MQNLYIFISIFDTLIEQVLLEFWSLFPKYFLYLLSKIYSQAFIYTAPFVFINLNPEPQVLFSAPIGVLTKNPPPVKS